MKGEAVWCWTCPWTFFFESRESGATDINMKLLKSESGATIKNSTSSQGPGQSFMFFLPMWGWMKPQPPNEIKKNDIKTQHENISLHYAILSRDLYLPVHTFRFDPCNVLFLNHQNTAAPNATAG